MEQICLNINGIAQSNTKNQNNFIVEVKKVEAKRKDLLNNIIKQKLLQKENVQPYLEKKLIIPSTFQADPQVNSIGTLSVFKHHTAHVSHQQYSNNQKQGSQHFLKNITSLASRKNSILNQYKSRDQIQKKLVQRWKLQMNSMEKNGLIFGKQLKIGANIRKKYLSDQQIRIIQATIGIRNKQKPHSVHYKRTVPLKKTKKKQKYTKIERSTQQMQDIFGLPSSFNIGQMKRTSIGREVGQRIQKMLKNENSMRTKQRKMNKAKSQLNTSDLMSNAIFIQQF